MPSPENKSQQHRTPEPCKTSGFKSKLDEPYAVRNLSYLLCLSAGNNTSNTMKTCFPEPRIQITRLCPPSRVQGPPISNLPKADDLVYFTTIHITKPPVSSIDFYVNINSSREASEANCTLTWSLKGVVRHLPIVVFVIGKARRPMDSART
ncbi:hypothetical protein B0H34DRAFT_225236 [Crassisporium funariophilum]|nr:hypothetical protein B0H34DRAFT_225236 [Crassisporium funariophilum]